MASGGVGGPAPAGRLGVENDRPSTRGASRPPNARRGGGDRGLGRARRTRDRAADRRRLRRREQGTLAGSHGGECSLAAQLHAPGASRARAGGHAGGDQRGCPCLAGGRERPAARAPACGQDGTALCVGVECRVHAREQQRRAGGHGSGGIRGPGAGVGERAADCDTAGRHRARHRRGHSGGAGRSRSRTRPAGCDCRAVNRWRLAEHDVAFGSRYDASGGSFGRGPLSGTSAGNATGKPPGDGSRAPAPRGKPIKRP